MAKTFKNAAEKFITSASEELSVDNLSPSKDADRKNVQKSEKKATRMTNKKKKERKSRRVNLLMYPSLVDDLKAKAEEEDTSLNDLMCKAAEEFLKNNYSK